MLSDDYYDEVIRRHIELERLKKGQKRRRERAYSILGIIYGVSIALFVLAVVSLIARCMGVI